MEFYEALAFIAYSAFSLSVAWQYHRRKIKYGTFLICFSILIAGAALCSAIMKECH